MSQRKRLSNSQGASLKRSSVGVLPSQADTEEPSLTQPSTSQIQRALEKLTPAQVDQKVAEVVQYLLVKDQKKNPFRRAEIVRHVVKEYKNVFPEIMRRASDTLERVFGFDLIELGPKTHQYILVNMLAATEDGTDVSPANPKLGLLFIILGFIFMKGGVLGEIVVWKFLKRLRVETFHLSRVADSTATPDTCLPLTSLVNVGSQLPLRYLEYNHIAHTDPVEHEFQWGLRAHLELSKSEVLEFMGELFNQNPQS